MRKYLGGGIPGIPPAPTTKFCLKEVDFYFQKTYKKLYERLPVLTHEDILRARYPYHAMLFRTMIADGFFQVVNEINAIAHLEQQEEKGRNLLLEKEKLTVIATTLKECEQFTAMGKRELGVDMKKNLAEKLIVDYNDVWLAIKFLQNVLGTCKSLGDSHPLYHRIEAEAHCVMACIAHGYPEYFENAADDILIHLDRCRELSIIHRAWQFKLEVAKFKIAKTATLQGLRKVYETISSSAMSLYIFATLLLQEVYFNIADNIVDQTPIGHHQVGNKTASEWAEKAVALAFEVRHPAALYTSILRYGKLLMKVGEVRLAMPYLQELHDLSTLNADTVTQAVALNNIGVCYDREFETVKALEQFDKQLELSESSNLDDTAGAAYLEMGKILLNEGQLWEAEECYQKSHKYMRSSPDLDLENDLIDITWAMIGISAGHNLWSRFAGLCRTRDSDNICRILQWKSRRLPLPLVGRPNYDPDLVSEFYEPHDYQSGSPPKDKLDPKTVTFKVKSSHHSDTKKQLMSSYREMLYQDENFEFASDVRSDNLIDYRHFSMYRAQHWARSLTVALAQRSTSFNAGVIRDAGRSGRVNYVDKQTPKDIQFFDYD